MGREQSARLREIKDLVRNSNGAYNGRNAARTSQNTVNNYKTSSQVYRQRIHTFVTEYGRSVYNIFMFGFHKMLSIFKINEPKMNIKIFSRDFNVF